MAVDLNLKMKLIFMLTQYLFIVVNWDEKK